MRKTIEVVLGKPSKFYHKGKRVSADDAYTYYTQGDMFKFGTNLTGLPADMVNKIANLLPPKTAGGLAAIDKATDVKMKGTMKHRKGIVDAGAVLHKAIGLMRTNPEKALKRVELILKEGYKGKKPDLNAKVKPWRNTGKPQSLNLLTQVVAHKFRGEFVHAYMPEDGDSNIPIPIVERYNGDFDEVDQPVDERKLVDTSRYMIIKALLAKGATFDRHTVNMALSMKDAFTAVELFNKNAQRPQKSQIKDFWTIKNKVDLRETSYNFQEIDDWVYMECAASNDELSLGNGVVETLDMIENATDFIDNC